MSEILEQLQIDSTFLVQFVLFVITFLILTNVYIRPFQKLLEKRNHKIRAEAQGAVELLRSVEAKVADYEKTLQALKTEAKTSFEKTVSDVRTKEDAALASYRDTLKKDYQNISQQLNSEKTKIEEQLKSQASALADGMVEQLLSGK